MVNIIDIGAVLKLVTERLIDNITTEDENITDVIKEVIEDLLL